LREEEFLMFNLILLQPLSPEAIAENCRVTWLFPLQMWFGGPARTPSLAPVVIDYYEEEGAHAQTMDPEPLLLAAE
jgi:hypothetical protein